ncbi:MAG: 16S rRNA (uracil1498-N3)-methyltransferase [Rhodobacteraceae bacterium HLUCCA12]|nr:MAG: 16S rRNA (uracil1498-N3)-methyltransferase [Rhodobacteraceae bacterium HLUCCA12]
MTDRPISMTYASRPKIRLYVEQPLGQGQPVTLSRDAAHYLIGVMRQGIGDAVALFNGRDGEWRARIASAGKRACDLTCEEPTAPQLNPPDLWLCFAPIKKARTDFIVEKAAELGVARICPVQTEYTNSERIRRDRLQAHAVEAAEQCGATFVPPVDDLQPLARMLDTWPEGRILYWADEAAVPGPPPTPLRDGMPAPAAILIGPEGGFSPGERARLADLLFVRRIGLGPRILRADTAAVAAITLWQAALGDWAHPAP